MSGSKRRLLALSVTATVLAGLLLGWTVGLVDADLIGRTESAVFLALVLLFLGSVVGFLLEYQKIRAEST